jgi:hypothetical protein
MGFDCNSLGSLMVYRKDGTKFDIDHRTTVELCLRSQETGEMMEDLIAEKYGTTVKTIRIM